MRLSPGHTFDGFDHLIDGRASAIAHIEYASGTRFDCHATQASKITHVNVISPDRPIAPDGDLFSGDHLVHEGGHHALHAHVPLSPTVGIGGAQYQWLEAI